MVAAYRPPKKIEFADTSETEKRSREIRLILNLIQPDPELQPFFVSDPATVWDVSGDAGEDIEARLNAYFGDAVVLNLQLPLWQLVDSIKRQYPQWPDEWPPEAN